MIIELERAQNYLSDEPTVHLFNAKNIIFLQFYLVKCVKFNKLIHNFSYNNKTIIYQFNPIIVLGGA